MHMAKIRTAINNLRCTMVLYNALIDSEMVKNNFYIILRNSFLVNIWGLIRAVLSSGNNELSLYNLWDNKYPKLRHDIIIGPNVKDPKKEFEKKLREKIRRDILKNTFEAYERLEKYINKRIFHFDINSPMGHDVTSDEMKEILKSLIAAFDKLDPSQKSIGEVDISAIDGQARVSFNAIAMYGKDKDS